MGFTSLLDQLLKVDLPRSLEIFLPELILCATIVVMLVLRVIKRDRLLEPNWVALTGGLLAFLAAFAQFSWMRGSGPSPGVISFLQKGAMITESGAGTPGSYFSNLLVHDLFTMYFRLGLSLFVVLVISLTALSGIPDREDAPDFYSLLLGSTVGMMLASSANHLLMLFISVEMMSVPSYAMVGFLKGRRQSSEAALKYVVYGAGTAGIMLYGASLLAGLTGTAYLPEISHRLGTLLNGQSVNAGNATVVTALLGIFFVLVGLAFKLSLVPFHFWCPDAFEGAAAEVGGYLSVASKAAAFALMVRFLLPLTDAGNRELAGLYQYVGLGLGVIAALTATFGNLAAYSQTNVKRLLAYSTIAHAGYMLMAVAAMVVLANAPETAKLPAEATQDATARSIEGLMYYIAVYLFMNLVAFSVVALIRNEIFSEEIEGYRGLAYQGSVTMTTLCVCLAISFFSLIGIPPFGGFFAKFMVFAAAFNAGGAHKLMWFVLAIGGLNTVFSLFYYLKVLKAMFIETPAVGTRPLRPPGVIGAFVVVITIPIVILGASRFQSDLTSTARDAATGLLEPAGEEKQVTSSFSILSNGQK